MTRCSPAGAGRAFARRLAAAAILVGLAALAASGREGETGAGGVASRPPTACERRQPAAVIRRAARTPVALAPRAVAVPPAPTPGPAPAQAPTPDPIGEAQERLDRCAVQETFTDACLPELLGRLAEVTGQPVHLADASWSETRVTVRYPGVTLRQALDVLGDIIEADWVVGADGEVQVCVQPGDGAGHGAGRRER